MVKISRLTAKCRSCFAYFSRMRKRFQQLNNYLKFRIQLTATNPLNFEAFWSLQLTRYQFFSAVIAVFLIGGFVVSILFAGLFSSSDLDGLNSANQQEFRSMKQRMELLTNQSVQQELYLEQLRKVLRGDISSDSLNTISDAQLIDPKTIDTSRSSAEKILAQKVGEQLGNSESLYRMNAPMTNVEVVEQFSATKHPFISLKPSFNSPLFAFAEGVVLSGKETRDGQLIMTFEGGIVVAIRNLKSVKIKAGIRTKIGEILAYAKQNQVIELEIRKGETPINPKEVFDFKPQE